MISITCYLASTIADPRIPSLPLLLDGRSVEQWFSVGSNGDIQLSVDTSHLADSAGPDPDPVAAYYLHEALARVTHNPLNATRVSRIALLFANHYAGHPPALGVMFDRGFSTDDDPNNSETYTGVAREGCAVFLGPISDLNPRDSDYQREVVFTAVHELGHVFNLQHPDSSHPSSFMSAGASTSAAAFSPTDIAQLSQCSVSSNVWPGGSRFGDTGTSGTTQPWFRVSDSADAEVAIHVSMARREFWAFEPVQLDVGLEAAGTSARCEIPDVLDPGYREFAVWIEEPSGERRRYQPSLHFCDPRRTRVLRAGQPFVRDLSIFGQSGGYTFTRAGVHRMWITLDLPKGRIRSNVLEVNVLPSRPASEDYRELRAILAAPAHARLLYYRIPRRRRSAIDALSAFAWRRNGSPVVAGVHYAVGRAMLHAARTRQVNRRARALEHLRAAVDHEALGPHSRRIARHLLDAKGET